MEPGHEHKKPEAGDCRFHPQFTTISLHRRRTSSSLHRCSRFSVENLRPKFVFVNLSGLSSGNLEQTLLKLKLPHSPSVGPWPFERRREPKGEVRVKWIFSFSRLETLSLSSEGRGGRGEVSPWKVLLLLQLPPTKILLGPIRPKMRTGTGRWRNVDPIRVGAHSGTRLPDLLQWTWYVSVRG